MKVTTRARRRAYGRVLSASSLTLETMSSLYMRHAIHFEDRASGERIMTPKEEVYLKKLRDQMNALSIRMMKLGHRLDASK